MNTGDSQMSIGCPKPESVYSAGTHAFPRIGIHCSKHEGIYQYLVIDLCPDSELVTMLGEMNRPLHWTREWHGRISLPQSQIDVTMYILPCHGCQQDSSFD
jgi:hypothetical protein